MAVAKRIVFVKAWTTAVQLALESKSPPAGRTLFHFEPAVGGHLGAATLRPVLPALGQEDRLAARLSNRRQRQHATPVVGAVLWQRTLDGAPEGTPIMPDGCLDLLWGDGNRLFVAGPDTAARWHRSPANTLIAGDPAAAPLPAHALRGLAGSGSSRLAAESRTAVRSPVATVS